MRYLSSSLAGLLLACSDDLVLSVEDDFEPTTVLFKGQSNSLTGGYVSGLTDASFAANFPGVLLATKQSVTLGNPITWQEYSGNLDSVTFATVDSIGAEASCLRDLYRAVPGKIHGVVCAINGAFFSDWNPVDGVRDPNVFEQAVELTRTNMTLQGTTRLVIVLSHGQSDATTLNLSLTYGAKLLTDIDAWEVEFPGTIWILRKVNRDSTYTGVTPEHCDNINAGMEAAALARPRVYVVDDNDVPLGPLYGPDNLHYNANGNVRIGHLVSGGIANATEIDIPPAAYFDVSVAGFDATFTESWEHAMSPGSAIVSRSWDFGDGNESTSTSPSHTYDENGGYDVTFSFTNAAGLTGTYGPITVTISGLAITSDATSGVLLPQNVTEWDVARQAEGTGWARPGHGWLMQDLSGNPANSIAALALTQFNTPAYQQTVAGFSTKSIDFTDGGGKSLRTTDASLADTSTTSVLALAIVKFPAAVPALGRHVMSLGSITGAAGFECALLASPAGRIRARSGASATVNGAFNMCDGGVHFVLMRLNRTTPEVDVMTELEKLSPTFAVGMAGKLVNVGSQSAGFTSMAGGVLALWVWEGADAERSDAQCKSMINFLANGYLTVGW